jgi:apolipoprotein N-acyltransferase
VFAWLALVPLLLVALGGIVRRPPTPAKAFSLGILTGAVYFAGTVYWTSDVMRTYGDLGLPAAVGTAVLLVAYLALYPAAFSVGVAFLAGRLGVHIAAALSPLVWVASELARTHLFTGFPWVLLGYSQITVLSVAQTASLFGVFGVSALVALVNTGIVLAILGSGRWRTVGPAAVALVLAVAVVWGNVRLQGGGIEGDEDRLRVGVIQGNILQDDKWDPDQAGRILNSYFSLSRQAAAAGAEFIVWPESSLPFFFEEDPFGARLVRRLVEETGATYLIGSDQIERGQPDRYYNAAFLLSPDGRTTAVYRKMHLVPFGEYVPLKRLLFFVSPLVEAVADFSPGETPVILPVEGRPVSTAICYEVVYPGLIRRFVQEGSQLLTTITNDAWYGYSSAPHQHFWQAAMRSIEQGRYLARAANTGISGFVDPYGRVLSRTEMFEPAALVEEVRLITSRTIYSRIGDLFAYLCLAATAGALLAAARIPRPRRHGGASARHHAVKTR